MSPEDMTFQDFVQDMATAILFLFETEDELRTEELEILQCVVIPKQVVTVPMHCILQNTDENAGEIPPLYLQ